MNALDQLPMWVVTEHPVDFPHNYVARMHIWSEHAQAYVPSADLMVCPDVEVIRRQLHLRGLVKLDRMPGDDPKVLETWL